LAILLMAIDGYSIGDLKKMVIGDYLIVSHW
jgi:hypothetical protein